MERPHHRAGCGCTSGAGARFRLATARPWTRRRGWRSRQSSRRPGGSRFTDVVQPGWMPMRCRMLTEVDSSRAWRARRPTGLLDAPGRRGDSRPPGARGGALALRWACGLAGVRRLVSATVVEREGSHGVARRQVAPAGPRHAHQRLLRIWKPAPLAPGRRPAPWPGTVSPGRSQRAWRGALSLYPLWL